MADDKKNIGPEAEKPDEAPREKKAEPFKDTPPAQEQPTPGAPQAPVVEAAPKAQPAPTVENQPEEKAAPAPKVLDFSAAKNKAPAKEETAPEKKPVKEQAAEKPKRGRPAKTDKPPAEKPKPPRDKMSQSKKAPGKEAPIAPKPEAAPKDAKAPKQEQSAAPRDATRSAKPEQIVYINLSELHPFKNHPFGVRDDSEMKGLVESVKASGVNQPALVRPREDGGYEIIAGHRRQKASELAGFANMPCIVRNMTDDEAILAMTDDNLRHREKILPTEKANSLKMQVEAIKHQGGPGLGEDAGKRSTEIVGERNGMNYKQVQRYIRLTELVPELQKMLDEKGLAFTPAVEISFIRPKHQQYIAISIEGQQSTPSLSQAQQLRKLDTIVNLAPTRQRLENDVFTVSGIAQKYNCAIKRLDWQQEQAFVSSLVLGYNGIEIQRGMTTSSTAIFIPFMTRELRMDGQALYYGMNALSHNVIMADRKKLKSANGLYLGSTGSGKSFAAKRELINVFLATNDRIVVVDPMGEYAPLVKRLGGQVIEIAPDSPNHINPMDIQMGVNDEDSPLSMKADFLLSLCELIVGGKEGLQPIEKTVIDRCVRLVYRELALGIGSGDMPLLQDLYEELLRQPEPEAKRVATALELYCTGSLNLFNHHTNVQTDARVVCIVLKGMGENLRKIAMHITNEFVTSAVNTNHAQGLATWGYFDEFHILLRDPLTASYFVAVWKMLRKKGCVPSALTQNVKDLLASREIEAILDNTDFMILLSQAQSDRAILAKQLGISEHQLSYITHSNSGEGLLFYGSVTIPFVDRFPKGEIYNLLTTRPEDVAHE